MAKADTYAGRPCKACGTSLRYVKEKRCVACRRQQDRVRNETQTRKQRDRVRNKLPHRVSRQIKLRAEGYHRNWERTSWLTDPRKRLLKKARERAKMYGREFKLLLSDIVVPEFCPLLGIPLYVGTRQVKSNSPTIDRKDSTRGYTSDNIWVISWRANRIKADGTYEELKMIVQNWPVR